MNFGTPGAAFLNAIGMAIWVVAIADCLTRGSPSKDGLLPQRLVVVVVMSAIAWVVAGIYLPLGPLFYFLVLRKRLA